MSTNLEPIPLLLWCPDCSGRHIDAGEFATKPHHTHACQWCGMVWRPAVVATVGVEFLPGFKDVMPPACTGITAGWCPRCGDCRCSKREDGERTLTDDGCPLHAPSSPHGEGVRI